MYYHLLTKEQNTASIKHLLLLQKKWNLNYLCKLKTVTCYNMRLLTKAAMSDKRINLITLLFRPCTLPKYTPTLCNIADLSENLKIITGSLVNTVMIAQML